MQFSLAIYFLNEFSLKLQGNVEFDVLEGGN